MPTLRKEEICPTCGETLIQDVRNNDTTYVCVHCNYYALTKKDLQKDRNLLAARLKIADLQHKLDDINGQLSRQLAANSIGSRKIDELSLQFLNAGEIAIQCQKYAREVESRLLIAIADAESLAAVLGKTIDGMYGKTYIQSELNRHEACAKLYNAVGG